MQTEGAALLDLDAFGAAYGYTIDGGQGQVNIAKDVIQNQLGLDQAVLNHLA